MLLIKRNLDWQQTAKGKGEGGHHNSRSLAGTTGLLHGVGLLVCICLSAKLQNDSVLTSLTGWTLLSSSSESKRDLQDCVILHWKPNKITIVYNHGIHGWQKSYNTFYLSKSENTANGMKQTTDMKYNTSLTSDYWKETQFHHMNVLVSQNMNGFIWFVNTLSKCGNNHCAVVSAGQ